MAGRRAIYDKALRTGAARAWERHWEEAVAAYEEALAEFPGDPEALAGLGMALSGAGRLEEALQALQQAAQIRKDDLVVLEQTAQVLERLGRGREAAQAYLAAAEQHIRRQAPSLAQQRWRDAVRVDPSCFPAHVNLLRAYIGQRRTQEALQEYLALARICQEWGEADKALELCQQALKLDPLNATVLALMDELRHGGGPVAVRPGTRPLDFAFMEETGEEGEPVTGSPVEAARRKALAHLAEAVFDEKPPKTGPLIIRPLSKAELDSLVSRAIDAQTHGDVDGAVAGYQRVLQAGVIEPAVNFNLGLLYQQQRRYPEAMEQFQQALDQPEYRLGGLFALAECYQALGRTKEALSHFLEVLRVVDLETVRQEQAEELNRLYDELKRVYTAEMGHEQARAFINTLVSFLSQKDWTERVSEVRQRLDALAGDGPVVGLAEVLTVPDSESILASIGLAQEYQRRGLEYAAIDELCRAMCLAPAFLPLHRQMAEVQAATGRVEQALLKLLTIAELYRVRGSVWRALAMYERALRVAPLDIGVRAKMIGVLKEQRDMDGALQQYLALGDTYYQMAQLDQAQETYSEALQLALQNGLDRPWGVRFLHRIGDLHLQRVEWRKATAAYERIRDLAPDDEKARVTLMDLYERLGRPDRAVAELDALLRACREAGHLQRAVEILQERVQERPDDIRLRARLAQAYLDSGDVPQALQQLDVLGDLQLQDGRTQDAIVTIKAILRLRPPNAEAYQRLLDQLMAGRVPE